MVRNTKYVIAVFVAALVFSCLAILAHEAVLLHSTGELGEVNGVTLNSHGPALTTDGSLSVLGRVSVGANPTVGRLKDSSNGPDTKSCINDGTHNGVRDRQVVWEKGYPGHPNAWFVADEVKDLNGTDRGGNCHKLKDPKERHQAQSITGGNESYHLNHN